MIAEHDAVVLRRARPDDVDFLVELGTHPDVDPFLAARRPRDRESLLAEIERSLAEPQAFGRIVVEVDGDRAGVMGYERTNERSRIARLGGLAIHPGYRGRHLADDAARLLQRHLLLDLGYHRLELEIYGFNERAIRHAERSGFVREGVRRKAYWRHGEWVDGVLFGFVREDLAEPPTGVELLHDHVARFNEGVRTGDFGPMLERFADDAELAFEGVPVGPFRGRDAIAAAYREQPPDDEITVLDVRERGDEVCGDYAWSRQPGVRAGELRLTRRGDRIARLLVTFE
ncbi:MAG: GNAT family N-acetyltransferase [Actinomycetota bacterium]|nr:GNAT family N-acetyltransferase [Actinomycetota bacterium]